MSDQFPLLHIQTLLIVMLKKKQTNKLNTVKMSHLKTQKQDKNKCEGHSGYIYLLYKAKHLPCFKSLL